tara:strand:+ start:10633 stop:10806 length:174 start_codon:yes stop_codon:yes gene_type:complete
MTQGTSTHELALTCALGITIGLFPILGVNCGIGLTVGTAMGLNQVVIQAANWAVVWL